MQDVQPGEGIQGMLRAADLLKGVGRESQPPFPAIMEHSAGF